MMKIEITHTEESRTPDWFLGTLLWLLDVDTERCIDPKRGFLAFVLDWDLVNERARPRVFVK